MPGLNSLKASKLHVIKATARFYESLPIYNLFSRLTILLKDFSKNSIQNILYRGYFAKILKLTESLCFTKFNYRDIYASHHDLQ